MKRSRFSEEQVIDTLRDAQGESVGTDRRVRRSRIKTNTSNPFTTTA